MPEQDMRENVIKRLESLHGRLLDAAKRNSIAMLDAIMVSDAIALLKTQEPVKPMLKREGWNKYYNDYVCPICDQELVYEQNFCSECGRAVKWE